MQLDKLPTGHISTDTAIKLINKHTSDKPLVDLQFLMDNLKYMGPARNYTIKLLQKGADGSYYSDIHVEAVVANERDFNNLTFAIEEVYKRETGKVVDPKKHIRKITTQVDDLDGSTANARENKKSDATYGMKIGKGTKTVGGSKA